MSLLITKEIGAVITRFKESCENTNVKQIACECSDAKTASLLFNIFKFADRFDWNYPLADCGISLQGQSIQLESRLNKPITPEKFDNLEKASLIYLRHLSTGWEESSTEESEKFKASLHRRHLTTVWEESLKSEKFKASPSITIDTANAVVLQKVRGPHLTSDSIVLDQVSKIQSDCKVSISNLKDRNFSSKIVYICGEREQLKRFFEIVRSSLSYEPKSLIHLTLEVLNQNYKRNDNDLNILPIVLRDRVNSRLPTPDIGKSYDCTHLVDRKETNREDIQELCARMLQECCTRFTKIHES